MNLEKFKENLKDYFVEIKQDKFTKVKTVKCKHNLIWKEKELENKFLITKKFSSDTLEMGIDYRQKDEIDSIFFKYTYTNSDGGYPGMNNIKMYLILDDDKNIELSEGSGFDHTSQSSKIGENYVSIFLETAQLAVSLSDFIAIANAKKIEYSIRFGQGSLEGTFKNDDLIIFKGFYNSTFDNDFELEELKSFLDKGGNSFFNEDGILGITIYNIFQKEGKIAAATKYKEITGVSLAEAAKYVLKFESKIKEINAIEIEKLKEENAKKIEKLKEEKNALYSDPIEKYFLIEEKFQKFIFNKEDSTNLIQSDTGFLSYWKNGLANQVLTDELKIGIKSNELDKSPLILIFPAAFVYSALTRLFQVKYNNIKSIEIKKGFINNTLIITDDEFIHKIVITNNDLLKFFISFLESEITKNDIKAEYIRKENEIEKTSSKENGSLIYKYNISETDVDRLKEIENEKAQLGLFSMKKEKLKSESLEILKPYNVKFMDLGLLIDEIKKSF